MYTVPKSNTLKSNFDRVINKLLKIKFKISRVEYYRGT